jgi:isoquinoline 1-oxidoreductase beta subunit
LKAALDDRCELIALRDNAVGQSIAKGTLFEAGLVREGVDRLSVEDMRDMPYAIPNMLIDLMTTESLVPVLWWRAVGSTHTAYALESFHG